MENVIKKQKRCEGIMEKRIKFTSINGFAKFIFEGDEYQIEFVNSGLLIKNLRTGDELRTVSSFMDVIESYAWCIKEEERHREVHGEKIKDRATKKD